MEDIAIGARGVIRIQIGVDSKLKSRFLSDPIAPLNFLVVHEKIFAHHACFVQHTVVKHHDAAVDEVGAAFRHGIDGITQAVRMQVPRPESTTGKTLAAVGKDQIPV